MKRSRSDRIPFASSVCTWTFFYFLESNVLTRINVLTVPRTTNRAKRSLLINFPSKVVINLMREREREKERSFSNGTQERDVLAFLTQFAPFSSLFLSLFPSLSPLFVRRTVARYYIHYRDLRPPLLSRLLLLASVFLLISYGPIVVFCRLPMLPSFSRRATPAPPSILSLSPSSSFSSLPPLVHRVPSSRLIISALIGSEEFRVG